MTIAVKARFKQCSEERGRGKRRQFHCSDRFILIEGDPSSMWRASAIIVCVVMAGAGCGDVGQRRPHTSTTTASPTTGSGPSPGLGNTNSALEGGTYTTVHPEVGKVVIGGGNCTATLIAPRIILLAGHCFGWRSTIEGNHGVFEMTKADGKMSRHSVVQTTNLGDHGVYTEKDVGFARLESCGDSFTPPAKLGARRPTAEDNATVEQLGIGCRSKTEWCKTGTKCCRAACPMVA